jgi:DNA-binding response OmpR family regulator
VTQSPSPDPAAQRVYIVDDEWIIAETLATILTRHGFQAYPFHSPNRAFVRAMDQPPDVLLTDVMMPDLSGIDLAIALRRAGNNCRILLFSGEACAVDLLCDARRRGYDFELLDKPLHPMQLLLRLRNSKRPSRRHLAESDEPSISPGPDLIVDPGSDPTSGSIPAA